MKRQKWTFGNLLLFIVLVLSLPFLLCQCGGGSSGGGGGGGGLTKCGSGDLDCYLEHMFIKDQDTGQRIKLIKVLTADLKALPGGTVGTTPSITSAPSTLAFAPPKTTGQEADIGWADPNGCRPILCTSICITGSCSVFDLCAKGVHDEMMAGVWRSYYGFSAEPEVASSTESFNLVITPVSDPNCTNIDDPLKEITGAGSSAIAGPEVPIPISITAPPKGGGGGGGGCSEYKNCCTTSGGAQVVSVLCPTGKCPAGTYIDHQSGYDLCDCGC
jgi:hypothetical protein